jgi:hypothetical protein
MLSQEHILSTLREWMQDLFEIEPETIQLESIYIRIWMLIVLMQWI